MTITLIDVENIMGLVCLMPIIFKRVNLKSSVIMNKRLMIITNYRNYYKYKKQHKKLYRVVRMALQGQKVHK